MKKDMFKFIPETVREKQQQLSGLLLEPCVPDTRFI